MNNQAGQKPKRELLPPNFVAFLAGVVLALAVGMIFRKMIDRMEPQKNKTAMRAQVISEPPASATAEPKNSPSIALSPQAEKAKVEIKTAEDVPPDAVKKAEDSAQVVAKKTGSDVAAEKADPQKDDESNAENFSGEIDYLVWRKQFRTFEEQLISQGIKNLNVTMTPRYRHQAKGLALTRGQFLDVVSKKVPANLPTRQTNLGMILHALSSSDFDTAQFTKIARESAAQLEPLCRAESTPLPLEGVERITVLLSNTPQHYKCLLNVLESNPKLTQVQEFSVVGFTRGSTFYGSLSADKKLLSLQMWNPDWLLDNTVGLEETGNEQPKLRRTLRLANVTRALGQPSDVRMQIPASFRPLVGPLIDPRDPTPPKPLIVGNFALVPSHMPRGSLIATAFTSPGQDRSKSATVKPPGVGKTKALVLATQGKKLQFMSVTRE
jgi:hypothetical protein